jgi:hypothetical protein
MKREPLPSDDLVRALTSRPKWMHDEQWASYHMADKPLRADIPIPAGATPREEAAIVAEDPQFQAILRRSREQSERGEEISIDDILTVLC